MDYILHIDTSTDGSSVAIGHSGTLIASVTNDEVRNHAASINNMIADVLLKADIKIEDLSCVAVCSGPGSYTGLRIAMATAKGICYATEKPLIMTDRLSLLANAYSDANTLPGGSMVASILTAREKEYFIGIYNNEHICILQPIHIAEQDLHEFLQPHENLHIISDAPETIFYQLKVNLSSFSSNIKFDINSWVKYAYAQYNSQDFVNISTSVPLYLKQVYTHKQL